MCKVYVKSLSHWLVNNGSFLLTESFCKKYLFSVTSLWCTLVNPLVVVHPTHILVHPTVHRAHRLKSAGLDHVKWHWGFSTVRNFAGTTTCCPNGLDFFRQHFFLLSGAVAKSLVGCFLLCKCALVCGKQAPQ